MPARLAPGAIIRVPDVREPGGQNPKDRRFVVLRHQILPTGEVRVVGAFVTGTLPKPLPEDHVPIEQWDPTGRCRTGLTKRSAAVCSSNYIYQFTFKAATEYKVIGFVDGQLRAAIVAKVNKLSAPPGGETGQQGTSAES
jgi:hypothetical protein